MSPAAPGTTTGSTAYETGIGGLGEPPANAYLSVRDLRVHFPTDDGIVKSVDGLSFDLARGKTLGIVGESGSGKSVTSLSIMGLHKPGTVRMQGSIRLDGQELVGAPAETVRGLRGKKMAMIFQDPLSAMHPFYTVGDQIIEAYQVHNKVPKKAARAHAIDLLGRVGIPQPNKRVDDYPHQFSGGMRQRAMIAMALACAPKLLLADEPTTALDVSLRGQMLELLDDLRRDHGMAVLLITHDLNLVRRFADRVAVMQHGRLVEQGATESIFNAPEHPYTRQLMASRPERDVVEAAADAGATPALSAQGLRVVYPTPLPGIRGWFRKGAFVALQGADFAIAAGRTLGVIGESGSGKSTLAQAALGLLPRPQVAGQVQVSGRSWQGRAGADRPLRRAVQVVFQDPFSSLSPRLTVEEIVGEGLRVHAPVMPPAERSQRVGQALADVGLTQAAFPGLLGRYPHEFSGGQRQRIGIARSLALKPRLIVADEPVSALDVSIQAQVINLLEDLQEELGLTYIVIAHDLSVVRQMSDRVAVMYLGNLVEIADGHDLYTDSRHPYTRALLSAVPIPDTSRREKRERIRLEGDVPSPIDPPPGCRFHTRCWKATDVCRTQVPPLVEIAPRHEVACHHPEDSLVAAAPAQAAAPVEDAPSGTAASGTMTA